MQGQKGLRQGIKRTLDKRTKTKNGEEKLFYRKS